MRAGAALGVTGGLLRQSLAPTIVLRVSVIRPRQTTAVRRAVDPVPVFVAACAFVCICKLYALYEAQGIAMQYSHLVAGLVAAAATYREISVIAVLCLIDALALTMRGRRPIAAALLHYLSLASVLCVLLINFVDAELLAKVGAPLTAALLYYSDVYGSGHGRFALLSWMTADPAYLALALLIVSGSCYAVAAALLKRVGRRPVVAIVSASALLIVAAGAAFQPVAPMYMRSGTAALLSSFTGMGQLSAYRDNADVSPPFPQPPITPGLQRPSGHIRNVIIVVLEATAARYLDVYGGPFRITPNLDAGEDHSLVISDAYAHDADSTLSLRTILSGRYQPVSPNPWMPPPPPHVRVPQLPQILSAAGFRTGFFYSDDSRYARTGDYLRDAGVQAIHDIRTRACDDRVIGLNGEVLANGDRCTFDDLERWLDERPRDPFFALLWTFQTHYPYHSNRTGKFPINPRVIRVERARHDMTRYLNAIVDSDALLASLIDHLRREGRADDTLILVTGDHGQAFGQHGSYGNGASLYEESVQVPFILINPTIGTGGSFQRISGHIDIAPTILDSLGLRAPPGWDGESVFSPSRRGPVYFANVSSGPVVGMRSGNRKIIADFVTGDVHVYDLSNDPNERHDLSGGIDRGRLARYRSWLAAWALRTNHQWDRSPARVMH